MKATKAATCAPPFQVEIETIHTNGRAHYKRIEFGNLANAVQWAKNKGWRNSSTSYILHNPAHRNKLATINRLLDFNGINQYKARYGSLNAEGLSLVFA